MQNQLRSLGCKHLPGCLLALQLYNCWLCDYYPWRTIARIDIRIPGYTSQVGGFGGVVPGC